MTIVVERQLEEELPEEAIRPGLFVVWIDTNCSVGVPDWEMNSDPQPLPGALDEAAEARAGGFPAAVLPEGSTPRPDGLFSNPVTDPRNV